MSWPGGQAVDHGAAARQLDRRRPMGAVHDRLDARAGRVGTRVDVRDQAHDRPVPASVAVT